MIYSGSWKAIATDGEKRPGLWKPDSAERQPVGIGDKHYEQYLSFRTAFETACRHAKLTGVAPHVLRHTFASRLVMQGVDLRTVQELGGWKSLNMVQRYAHFSQEHMRQAVELLVKNYHTTP